MAVWSYVSTTMLQVRGRTAPSATWTGNTLAQGGRTPPNPSASG